MLRKGPKKVLRPKRPWTEERIVGTALRLVNRNARVFTATGMIKSVKEIEKSLHPHYAAGEEFYQCRNYLGEFVKYEKRLQHQLSRLNALCMRRGFTKAAAVILNQLTESMNATENVGRLLKRRSAIDANTTKRK